MSDCYARLIYPLRILTDGLRTNAPQFNPTHYPTSSPCDSGDEPVPMSLAITAEGAAAPGYCDVSLPVPLDQPFTYRLPGMVLDFGHGPR
jgi:hypothetical protein